MSEIIGDNQKRDRSLSETSDNCECDLQFKPIVSLPEVEVPTNEENEIILLKLRAKLYRFDKSSSPSEWKERGTGEMKMLQHKENYSIRIVMRRDKTLKVCANHFITPWMVLTPSSGSERAFVYTVPADFADEEPKQECLAIKFANVDNANSFKNKFEEAKDILLKKCSLYNGKSEESGDGKSDDSEDENLQNNEKSDGDKKETEITEKLAELKVENESKKEN